MIIDEYRYKAKDAAFHTKNNRQECVIDSIMLDIYETIRNNSQKGFTEITIPHRFPNYEIYKEVAKQLKSDGYDVFEECHTNVGFFIRISWKYLV